LLLPDHLLYLSLCTFQILGPTDLNSKAFVTTRAQLREENKQVQRAGKKGEKSKIKATDIGLVDTQLEEGDLHSHY
jgi:hypothetical protein